MADELAAAVALLMGQTSESIPVVLFRVKIPRGGVFHKGSINNKECLD